MKDHTRQSDIVADFGKSGVMRGGETATVSLDVEGYEVAGDEDSSVYNHRVSISSASQCTGGRRTKAGVEAAVASAETLHDVLKQYEVRSDQERRSKECEQCTECTVSMASEVDERPRT